ncbi:hypothetical protein CHS0354_022206 [Potamilus streckersoni]|uniref:TNase-like domain-containing protein n=1 Tax=Potamilus streckersoni TaxID=2493646 RepID=A0AAE0T2P7_9BIVA|nr:hypothetical protein CHS0354_022206 [Potamilus streckersoni]
MRVMPKSDKSTGLTQEYFDKLHTFFDSNIRGIKYTIYGVGFAGLVLIARSIQIAKVFKRVEDIPAEFISKHVKLQGNVCRVQPFGVLYVRHIPIITSRWKYWETKEEQHLLPVKLAFLDVTPAGNKWLVDKVTNKNVWFTLLAVEPGDPPAAALCHVKLQRNFLLNKSINLELVKLGLCKISSYEDLKTKFSLSTNVYQSSLLDELIQAESHAIQKKIGLWADMDVQTREKTLLGKAVRFTKKILLSPFSAVGWVIKKLRR